MSQVDNSGFRLMKAHSAYGVERAVLFVFHPCAYDGHGDRISTLCYWVRITESRTGFMVSDAISTLDIRYWLMLRVRTIFMISALFLQYHISYNEERVTDLLGIKNASENYTYLIPKANILFNEETPAKVGNETRMANIIILI